MWFWPTRVLVAGILFSCTTVYLILAPSTSKVNEARRPHTYSKPCAFEEKKRRKKTHEIPPHTKHHEIHRTPATATTSKRRATIHVPRVSPYSPASIDPGFEEIGLVQLSQLVKTTNVTHTHRDRLLNNGNLYAPRYEEAFLP